MRTLMGRISIKKVRAICASVIVLGVFFYIFSEPFLEWLPGFLTLSEPLQKCDAIYVLGGDYEVREPGAAWLYRQGWASRILLAREPDGMGGPRNFTDVTVSLFQRDGVPPDKITQLHFGPGVRSTADESRALREYLRKQPMHRILLVTSAIHTRRAVLALRRGLSSTGTTVIVFAAQSRVVPEEDDEKRQRGRQEIELEFFKYVYYGLTFWPQLDF